MKSAVRVACLICTLFCASGCTALIIGGAVGALGGYAISKDTIQGDTDKSYIGLWDSVVAVSRSRGTIIDDDRVKGYLNLETADSSKVYIRLTQVTRSTTRLKVSARKHKLPNLSLAQELYTRIIEEAE